MTKFKRGTLLRFVFMALLGRGTLPIHAEEVLVSAQRIQKISTKVLNKDDILSLQEQTLTEVLRHQWGLHVATSGGPFGKKAFFSMRGTESGQVLVIIDGVDMGDPTAPQTAARLEHLSLQDVERLEILKGTQSVLYGDSAIGGVVAITTKQGQTTPTTLRLKYGSFNHQDIGLSTGGVSKKWQYAFSANAQKADGISAYPRSKDKAADLDPYSHMTLSANLERSLSPDITVGGGMRMVEANTKYDGFNVDNKENEEDYTSLSYNLQYKMMHNRHFNPKVIYTSMSTKRLDTGTFSKGQYFNRPYEGRRQSFELSNKLLYGQHHSLLVGAKYRREKAAKLGGRDGEVVDNKTDSLYAMNSLFYGPLFSTQGIRYHRHNPFGEHTAYALEVGAHIHRTTFKAKMATGLKVPSLYQSFAPFGGNPDLRPESGRTLEFGLIQEIPRGDVEVTAFQVQSKNLIDWDNEDSKYINIKQTRSHGLELAGTVALWRGSSLSLYTTYTKAMDRQTKKPLLKRPKWKRGATLKNSFGRSKVALDWNFVGATKDYGDALLSSYHLVHLRASYHFKDQGRLQAKMGNVFNKTYEETAGYAVLGRHVSIQYALNL